MANITLTKGTNAVYVGTAFSVFGDFYLQVEASEKVDVIVTQKPDNSDSLEYTHAFALEGVKKWGGTIKNESPVDLLIKVEIRYANTSYNGADPKAYYYSE